MASPTQRTLKLYRDNGWTIQVVERWIPQTRRRLDLFGCIDLIAVQPLATPENPVLGGTLGIQATSTGNMTARIAKSLAEPRLRIWLQAGNRFLVVGWAKRGKKGQRKLWTWKEKEITLGDIP